MATSIPIGLIGIVKIAHQQFIGLQDSVTHAGPAVVVTGLVTALDLIDRGVIAGNRIGSDVDVHFVSPEGNAITKPIARNLISLAPNGASATSAAQVEKPLLKLFTNSDILNGPGLRWIVRPILAHDQNVVVFGDSASGKTFLMIDAAMHWAAGEDWNGCHVPHSVRIAYVLACWRPSQIRMACIRRLNLA